jgi:hypothetical protein
MKKLYMLLAIVLIALIVVIKGCGGGSAIAPIPAAPSTAATPQGIYVNAAMSDDSGNGLTPSTAKKYITSGITLVDAGGTVNVAAGTYTEQINITKSLSMLGAGVATTFIDGTGVTPVLPGLVNITNETGAVTLDGFTIRNAPASGGTRITIWARQADEGPVYSSSMTITHNILVGSGHLVSTNDYGLYSKYNKSNLVFSNNDVSNFGGNAFLFELHTGPAEISHNTITVDPDCGSTAFFSMSYKDGYANNNNVTGKQWLHDNTINANGESAITIASAWGYSAYNNNTYGAYTNVEITDNIITNVGDAKKGIQLEVDGDNGGFVNSPIIARNTISAKDPGPGPGLSRGIRIMGVMPGAQILDNVITGFYRGIYQSDSFSHLVYPTGTRISGNVITGGTYGIDIAGGTVAINGNSIVGNTLFGVNNQTVAAIDATNNWWGSASGPGVVGSGTGDKVSANVTFSPWLTVAP